VAAYDVYRRSPANIERLAAALQHLDPYLRGAPLGLPFRCDERTISRGLNFTLSTSAGDARWDGPKNIDAIAELEAINEEQEG